MTRTENTVRNLLFSILAQFVSIVLTFISRNIFINSLGVEILGVNSLFGDILSSLSLADLGVGMAILFSYYEPLAKKDYKKIASLTNYYKKVYRVIAGIVLAAGLVLMLFLDKLINTSSDIPGLYLFYLLALANTVASYLMIYKSTIVQADQKGYIFTSFQMIIDTVKTLLQMVVLFFTHSYTAFLVIILLSTVLKNIMISKKADELYPYLKTESAATISEEEKKGLFQNFSSVFIYKIASVAFTSTDNTLISIICGTIYVGLYSNYKIIAYYLEVAISMIFAACTASIGNLMVEGSPERRYDVFNTLQTLCYIFSIVSISCFFNLVDDFITCWLSGDILLDMRTLVFIAMNLYLVIVLRPIISFREAAGLYQKVKYFMIAATVVNIVLSIILGIKWGLAGIFAATVIARLTTYIWYEPRILFSTYFSRSEKTYYLGLLVNFIVTCLVTVLLYFVLKQIHVGGWIGWFIKAVVSVAISGVICILVYRNTTGFKWLLYKAKSVVGRAE